MAVSKYSIGTQRIRKMSEKQLDDYIKGGVKVVNLKYQKMKKGLGQKAIFSELINDYDEVVEQVYMGARDKLSSSVKGLSKQQKQIVAEAINRVSSVDETLSQVKKEYKGNIEDYLFKNPTITEKIINELTDEKIVKYGKSNIDFIRDILGSDNIKAIAEYYGEDNALFYNRLINDVSDELLYFDDDEKLELLNEWVTPE